MRISARVSNVHFSLETQPYPRLHLKQHDHQGEGGDSSHSVSSLEMFKARLNGTLGNLSQWEISLPTAGGLELGGLYPFRPKPYYDFRLDPEENQFYQLFSSEVMEYRYTQNTDKIKLEYSSITLK